MGASGDDRYDAFLSYSHGADARFSRALHRALESFGRTSRQDSPLTIFRDESNLAAVGQLTPEIQSALGRSEWLLLLASPQAAGSAWVNQELDWWWERHGSWDRLLVAVTDGDVGWSAQEREALGNRSAIPPSLADRVESELIWQDLRPFSRADAMDTGSADVRLAVAGLAAPLRGVGKAELIGFHVEWQRGEVRRSRRVAIALGAAGIALALAAGVAFVQGSAAATANVTANARLLSSTALAVSATDDELAKLLAVEGFRLHRDAQTTAALYRTAGANAQRSAGVELPAPVPVGRQGQVLTGSGEHVMVVTEDGALHWNTRTDETELLDVGGETIVDVAVSDDGTLKAVATADEVTVWQHEESLAVAADDPRIGVDGNRLVVIESPTFVHEDATRIRVVDVRDGSVLDKHEEVGVPSPDEIGVEDGVVTIASQEGTWQRRLLNDLRTVRAESDQALAPTNGATLALAPDARYFGYVQNEIRAFANYPMGEDAGLDDGFHATDPLPAVTDNGLREEDVPAAYVQLPLTSGPGTTSAFALSRSGDRYLVAGGDETWVTSLDAVPGNSTTWQLTGAGLPEAAVFLTNDRVVTADDGALTLWDLSARPHASDELNMTVPDGPTVGFSATLAVSDDGERRAVVGGHGQIAIDEGTGPRLLEADKYWPLWRSDGSLLVADTSSGYVVKDGAVEELWRDGDKPSGFGPFSGLYGAWIHDDRLILVDGNHDVQVRDAESGELDRRIKTSIPDPEDQGWDTSIVNSAALSPDGTTVGIATGDERGTYLVNLDSGATERLPGEGIARGVLLTGEAVIVVRPQQVDVLDDTGTEVRRVIPMEGAFVHAVAMVPGTALLVRVRNDGHLVIFDTATGDALGDYPMPAGQSTVNAPWATATLTAEAGGIYSASANAPVTRWDLGPAAVVEAACAAASRDLRSDEWATVASLDPPDDLTCARDE